MDCIFCGEKDSVHATAHSIWGTKYQYVAECEYCGARGQAHNTAAEAEQEWRRVIGYKAALEDILHGPCAAPGWTGQKHRRLLEQIAHDALYGPDDTEHVGNWLAWEEKEKADEQR